MDNYLFVLLQYLVPKRLISELIGFFAKSQNQYIKTFFIRNFHKTYNVNMQEAVHEDLAFYPSFNSFFTRPLKPELRPIEKNTHSIISPADGVVSQIGNIKSGKIIQAKGVHFNLLSFLGNDREYFQKFKEGVFCTIYLSPKDYHRVHMPCDGKLIKTIHVPGRLFSVAKHAVNKIKNLYARNERLICKFKNEMTSFSVIFVAAINVSSIEVSWKGEASPPYPKKTISSNYSKKKITYDKGEEFGMFKSGSTVIILFDATVEISKEIRKGQKIRVGQKIGLLK